MKLNRLRYFCEVVEHDLNISRTAADLHATQPGISRQLQLLEAELGIRLLLRRKNKIVALTRDGELVLHKARQVIRGISDLKDLRNDILDGKSGKLVVATTHFHARFTLLEVVQRFRVQYPRVSISIQQEDPDAIAMQVRSGQADFGVSVDVAPAASGAHDLAYLPCYSIRRLVITPIGHPLLKTKRLTLEAISQYPLIAYNSRYSAGWRVLKAFESKGLKPDIALSATDADVIKAYVAAGLGIAAIQEPAFDVKRDRLLRAIPAGHLFEPVTAMLTIRRDGYLRNYTYDFIRLLAPDLMREQVLRALE